MDLLLNKFIFISLYCLSLFSIKFLLFKFFILFSFLEKKLEKGLLLLIPKDRFPSLLILFASTVEIFSVLLLSDIFLLLKKDLSLSLTLIFTLEKNEG